MENSEGYGGACSGGAEDVGQGCADSLALELFFGKCRFRVGVGLA